MSKPDYEILFKEALIHLRCVSGSRNSFTANANKLLFSPESHAILLTEEQRKNFKIRQPAVESMHHAAVDFLRKHDR